MAAGLLLVVGVVAVIAGRDTASADPVKLLGAAPDAVRDAGSARMTMTMTMDMKGQAVPAMSMSMTAEGLIDFTSRAGSFSMDGFGQHFEMLTDGTTFWMQMPSLATAGHPELADKWIATPLPTDAGASGGLFGPGEATSFLDVLRGVGGTIVDLGAEAVNGVDAHHYAVAIDLDKAMASLPPDEKARAEQGLAVFGVDRLLPVDVWITDAGLPVRTVFDVGREPGSPLSFHIQMDLADFGTPVHITAPPADQVIDMNDPSQLTALIAGVTS